MEKNKSNLADSVKYLLTKSKFNSAKNLSAATKTADISLNKTKPSKNSSIKNLTKVAYVLKKSHKKGNDSLLHKTSLCTPGDTTALVSCISTPGNKYADKRNFFKGLDYERIQAKLSVKENFVSTDEGRPSEDSLRIVFTVHSKLKFEKFFCFTETLEQVKKQLVSQLMKKDKKINTYHGLIGLYSMNNNDGIDKLLRVPNLPLTEFQNRQIFELNLKVILAKKEVNYKNLQFCDFQLKKYLGNGGFSSVYLARCLIDGRLCALKLIKKSSIVSQNKYKMLQNEKNILFTIDHHRLVDLYYAFESKNYIVFGLQYCPNGNLYQLIQKRKSISEDEAKFLFSQILEGLASLHAQKILFRDVKLENILFDENGNVKITDFGLSKPEIRQQDITYSYCGSPEYMAPQMLAKIGHNFQIDHYALGILLYELLYGHSPFYAAKKQDIFYAIMNSEPQFPKAPMVSKQVKSLIKGLLQKNPKHRIGSLKGVQQIMSHPWLRGYSTKNMESPFKLSLSVQNIFLNCEQSHQLQKQFSEDFNVILKQKLFFTRSFVNKALAQKLDQSIVKFSQKERFSKQPKSTSKGKTAKLIR